MIGIVRIADGPNGRPQRGARRDLRIVPGIGRGAGGRQALAKGRKALSRGARDLEAIRTCPLMSRKCPEMSSAG
jgi:hypothetical protein